MATRKSPSKKTKRVEDYRHADATRLNNQPAGLAWQDVENEEGLRRTIASYRETVLGSQTSISG